MIFIEIGFMRKGKTRNTRRLVTGKPKASEGVGAAQHGQRARIF
jgi:hypothetical protein